MRRLPKALGTLAIVTMILVGLAAHDALGAMVFAALGYVVWTPRVRP